MPFEVRATEYVGGSPEAALAILDSRLDSALAAVDRLQTARDPAVASVADTLLRRKTAVLRQVIVANRTALERLTPADRPLMAAFYSANRDVIDFAFNRLTAVVTLLSAPDTTVVRRLGAATVRDRRVETRRTQLHDGGGLGLAVSAADFAGPLNLYNLASADRVTRCDGYATLLGDFDQVGLMLERIAGALRGLSLLAPSPFTIGAAAVAMGVAETVDYTSLGLQLIPVLLVPDGLELRFNPVRIDDGQLGFMSASVRLRPAGAFGGTLIDIGGGFGLLIGRWESFALYLSDRAPGVRGALAELAATFGVGLLELGAPDVENWLNDKLRPISRAITDQLATLDPASRTTVDPVFFPGGLPRPDLWTFTPPVRQDALLRGYETVFGSRRVGDQTITLTGKVQGSQSMEIDGQRVEVCTAETRAPDPSSGRNGFVVAESEGTVRIVFDPSEPRLPLRRPVAGELVSGGVSVGVINRGTGTVRDVAYQILDAAGNLPTLPAGLQVNVLPPFRRDELRPDVQDYVALSASATVAVPIGLYRVPLSVTSGTRVVGTTTINVAVGLQDSVFVRGAMSNPWLAGVPDGTTTFNGDVAPANAPYSLLSPAALTAGTTLEFRGIGILITSPGGARRNPDGIDSDNPGAIDPTNLAYYVDRRGAPGPTGAEHGISGTRMRLGSLVGVFLGPGDPRDTPAPPAADWRFGEGYGSTAPQLKQLFFIGDGRTGVFPLSVGAQQRVVVPPGATRLYVGVMDPFARDNGGGYVVTVRATPAGSAAASITATASARAAVVQERRARGRTPTMSAMSR